MIEAEIVNELMNGIGEILPIPGLKFEISPAKKREAGSPEYIASISIDGKGVKAAIEVLPTRSSAIFRSKLSSLVSYADRDGGLVPLILSDYLSKEKREECKGAGVLFIDLSGNAYISHGGIYVEREGFPNKYPERRLGRGPFSDKASLILRVALEERSRSWGVREVAQAAGLDPGFVSRMMRELEIRGYFGKEGRRFKLLDAKSLLEDWISAYDYRKNEEHGYFCLADNPGEILDRLRDAGRHKSLPYALSFQAGANLVTPHSVYSEVHIYLRDESGRKFLERRLKLREVERGANVILCYPHYRYSAFHEMHQVEGLWVVSDLQLYLDLYKYPLRGLEQAEYLYRHRLKRLIEG
ncbi:MAG: type IV toxin-antitoxin system AbiEi family antitoxin [Actinomycetota bacterium]